VAAVIKHPPISWERRPLCEMHTPSVTQSVTISPDSEFKLSITGGCILLASLTLLLPSHSGSASFQLESILDSKSILEAPMSSESGAVHWRYCDCKGCTAPPCEMTLFNDYLFQLVTPWYSQSWSLLLVEHLASGSPKQPHLRRFHDTGCNMSMNPRYHVAMIY
jgi:hypothetical protein